MVNVTISITEELKAEMDNYSDINWSEVCRRAIAKEIQMKKNPTPDIGLLVRDVRPETARANPMRPNPGLDIALNIYNKMPFDIVLDRILCKVRFRAGAEVLPASDTFYLRRTEIQANREVNITLSADITERKITELDRKMESTFYCELLLEVFVDEFEHALSQMLTTRVPIDEWKKMASTITDEM